MGTPATFLFCMYAGEHGGVGTRELGEPEGVKRVEARQWYLDLFFGVATELHGGLAASCPFVPGSRIC